VTVLKQAALEAERVILELLAKMEIPAEIEHRLGGAEQEPAIIDIRGEDLGLLIGWRGETLRALQLLVNTMVRQSLPDAEHVVIDVERYRARREDSVRELALRVADRAKRNRERIGLEPMLPYERRVVHTTLAEDPEVSTESEGEEPTRRVVITPKDARGDAVVDYGRTQGGFGARDGFSRGPRAGRGFGGGGRGPRR
jgi:spoIIIJ-associated protein